MVFVQTLLVLPIITALARQVVADALRDGGDQLRSMGASPLLGALLMLLHERWAVVDAAPDRVRPRHRRSRRGDDRRRQHRRLHPRDDDAIALETSKGDLPLALALGFVLLAVVALLNS